MKKITPVLLTVVGASTVFYLGALFERSFGPSPSLQTENQTFAALGTARLYGKMESVGTRGEVRLRLVDFVQGADNQEQAALESGQCNLERIEKDECLPNRFFIRETEKVITLAALSDARAVVYARGPEGGFKPDQNGDIYTEEISFAQFSQLFSEDPSMKDTPFIIRTKNGRIAEIQEQYIP